MTQTGEEIQVIAFESDFTSKQHYLIQAILAVNDLFYVARANIQNFFIEDGGLWLNDNNIRYISDVTLLGKSHFNLDLLP